MKRDLSRLLRPRSIAVFGGQEAARVVEQCDKLGFAGEIWPVHPIRDTMGGRPCCRSVAELPYAPDAAYVAVNREASIAIVEGLAKAGCGGVICYAAGFAETAAEQDGAADLQARLVAAAGEMPLVGPNCYGLINALDRVALWPDQHGATACDGGVAIITQSSNIAINLTMQKRGLPMATIMTAGNQAQTGISDLAMAALEDDRITALGLHIEGLDALDRFQEMARRARQLGKPVVVLKVGRSDLAQRAALTHTASLAGSDTAHDALFKRLGIARVHTLEALLETLKLLHCGGALAGDRLLSLSCSGGEASLMADAAEGRAVSYPAFDTQTRAALRAELGPLITIANPLDYNTFIWGDWPATTRMFEAALTADVDLAILVLDFPRGDRCDQLDWKAATDAFVAAVRQTGRRAAVLATLAETMPEEIAENLMGHGIAPLCGISAAINAAEAASATGKAWSADEPLPMIGPPDGASPSVRVLDEAESKTRLAKAGLIVPRSIVVKNGDDLTLALKDLSFPLAVKALGIAHKSEAGAVRLHCHTTDDVADAIASMAGLAPKFLVEEMAAAPLAELIVGISLDPVCGHVLTIGAGGVLTELLDDTASLLLPVTERDIYDALAELKIGRLLDGFRKSDAADIDALVANILCIAHYAQRHRDTLVELDVNPLFATQFGSVAVDALIVERT